MLISVAALATKLTRVLEESIYFKKSGHFAAE